jgi:DUF917 family protein
VSIEKIENGDEGDRLRHHLEDLTGRSVAALMAGEIGGGNGLLPIAWAARLGLPIVDADGMGRAFPEVSQVTMHLAGISPSPAVMTDERGNPRCPLAVDLCRVTVPPSHEVAPGRLAACHRAGEVLAGLRPARTPAQLAEEPPAPAAS